MEAAVKGHTVIAIVGPTASGKTRLALEWARAFDLQLISVDSRKIYRGMDIGTAKPEPKLRPLFSLIDILDPDTSYSAQRFAHDAEQAIRKAFKNEKIPVLVGGTVLYYKALFEGFFPAPEPDPELRARLLKSLREHGSGFLHRQLSRIDPEAGARIHRNDWIRITRALELYYMTGQTPTQLRTHRQRPEFSPVFLKLEPDRPALYRNINQRVDRMMQQGLLDETASLLDRWGPDAPGLKTIGYRELIDHITANESLESAVARIKKNTRTFARKQIYFMRGLKPEIGLEQARQLLGTWSHPARP